MATLSACNSVDRPTFPGSDVTDTLPPQIQIVEPLPGDTVVTSGTNLPVRVEAHDPSGVAITVDVTGAVAFSVPVQIAPDTSLGVAFALPIASGKQGQIVITAVATDGSGNTGSKTFAFVVK